MQRLTIYEISKLALPNVRELLQDQLQGARDAVIYSSDSLAVGGPHYLNHG